MNRKQFLEEAATVHFDVCIIGGGATGAGCALEAQSRGLQTILVEREDFASGTSSKSTKLIHGGVRYLEQAVKKLSYSQYAMVRKALHERKTLIDIAPHAARPLALLTPCANPVAGLYYFIGLKLYDWLSGNRNIGRSRLLSKKQALAAIPELKASSLYNAVLYYDGQMDDQRLNMAVIQTASEKGAVCLNHCKAAGFVKNGGRLQQLLVQDQLTGRQLSIKARVFINACGPFADAVRLMANESLKPRIRVSRGVHILLPRKLMPSETGMLIPATKDGRVIFVLPYDRYLLAGTTDEEVPLTEEDFGPSGSDVDYILSYVNQYLDIHAKAGQITGGFGGLRPLVAAGEHNTKDLVRDHIVETDPASGLISILGGKWTTYRVMAKDTINAAAGMLGVAKTGVDNRNRLLGSRQYNKGLPAAVRAVSGCAEDIAAHLVSKYGDRSLVIAETARADIEHAERLAPGLPYTYAELLYVLEHEMACTVKDVLNRRWGLEITNWQQTLDLIPVAGAFMSSYFEWDEASRQQYITGYAEEIKMFISSMNT